MMKLEEARALTNLIVSTTFLTLEDLHRVFILIFPRRFADVEIADHLKVLLRKENFLIPGQRLAVLSILHRIYSPYNLSPNPLTELLSSSDSVRKTEQDFIQHLSSGNGAEVLYQSVRNFDSSTPKREDRREEIVRLLQTQFPMEELKFGNFESVLLLNNELPPDPLSCAGNIGDHFVGLFSRATTIAGESVDPFSRAGVSADNFIEKAMKDEVDTGEAGKFVGLLVAFPNLLTGTKITPENIKEVFKRNQSVALDTINLLADPDKYLIALGEVSEVLPVMLPLAIARGRHAELASRYLLAKALECKKDEKVVQQQNEQMRPYLKELEIAPYAIRSGFSTVELTKLIIKNHVIHHKFLEELFAMEKSYEEMEGYFEVILHLGDSCKYLITFVEAAAENGRFSIGSARHFIKKSTSSCINIGGNNPFSRRLAGMVAPILKSLVTRNDTLGHEFSEDLHKFCKIFKIEKTKGLRMLGFGN